jgi:hypothetical protein
MSSGDVVAIREPTAVAEPGPAGPVAPEGRNELRARLVRRRASGLYCPWIHLTVPSLIGLALVAGCVLMLREPRAWELLCLPPWLVACNASEWWIHRHLMHHRVWAFYDRHTPEHHAAYTSDDMAIQSPREFPLVLIPGYAVVILFVGTLPILGVGVLAGQRNLGLLLYAASVAYVLAYEWLHLLCHLPARVVGDGRLVTALRRHHALHHSPRFMQQWNFNVTVPLWDRVRRTRHPGAR